MGEKAVRDACGTKDGLSLILLLRFSSQKNSTRIIIVISFPQYFIIDIIYSQFKYSGDLLTIAVAPHQVYGPRDGLFLPSLLQTAATGKLRIFGSGDNLISFCHVDNYCHGLILGGEALYPGN